MRRRTSLVAVALLSTAVLAPISLLALETRVREVRTVGRSVRAALDVRDMFPENLRGVLQSGGTLHMRIQAELWEDRPMWDRLVRPAAVTVFRIDRDRDSAQVAIADAVGQVGAYASYPEMVPLRVDVVPADAVSDGSRYYLRLMTTIGTIAERELENTGDAVFGRDESTVSIANMGKLLFRTVVQMTDYLQSVSTEARSRVFEGRELNGGVR